MNVRKQKIGCIGLALALMLTLTVPQPAEAADGRTIGLWTGAGFCSLLYTPAKAVTFLGLGLAGGFSMFGTVPAGRIDISEKLMKWGYYGDWLIRPDHLTGDDYPHIIGFEEEIHFISPR